MLKMAHLMKWSRFINFCGFFYHHQFFLITSSNQSCRAIQRLTYNISIFRASAPAFAPIVVKCVSRLMLNPTFIGAGDLFWNQEKFVIFDDICGIVFKRRCLWKCWHCEIDSKCGFREYVKVQAGIQCFYTLLSLNATLEKTGER